MVRWEVETATEEYVDIVAKMASNRASEEAFAEAKAKYDLDDGIGFRVKDPVSENARIYLGGELEKAKMKLERLRELDAFVVETFLEKPMKEN